MYNRDRVVLVLILVLFVAEVASMWTILVISIPQITFSPQCLITSTPRLFSAYWYVASQLRSPASPYPTDMLGHRTISLAFETTLFALTLLRFVNNAVVTQFLQRRSILFLLVRDGTWAYAIIFGERTA